MVMKFFMLLLLCIIIACGAVESAETEGYGYGYRQCSCAEQTECFDKLKFETEKCFADAHQTLDADLLTKAHADLAKTRSCFDRYHTYVKDWISCIDTKLAKESSCLATKSEQKIPSDNFKEIYAKIIRENVEKRMNRLYGLDKHVLVELEQKWHDSAKECAFNKFAQMSCFTKNSCVLKGAEKEVKKVVKQCYKELDLVSVHRSRCECLTTNVPGSYGYGLTNYCDKVKVTTFQDD